jgi:thymidine phosphorylase
LSAKKGDAIDPAVGIVLGVKVGNKVKKRDSLCEIHAASPEALGQARDELKDAFRITRGKVKPLPLFYRKIR